MCRWSRKVIGCPKGACIIEVMVVTLIRSLQECVLDSSPRDRTCRNRRLTARNRRWSEVLSGVVFPRPIVKDTTDLFEKWHSHT